MHNVRIKLRPGETPGDLIEQICETEHIGHDQKFAFSALLLNDVLKINCLIPPESNPYTPQELVSLLYATKQNYVVPPLELWFSTFRPLLHKMVSKAYPFYQTCIPDKEELMCILNFTIVKLYDKGYYLHQHLIYKSFINELNMEVRKTKNFTNCVSLDEEIGSEDGNNTMTRQDLLECPCSTEISEELTKYTVSDYWSDMFDTIKAEMLKSMSQLSFDRILIQLKTKTVDTTTSKQIQKVRQKFNPGNPARPNAFGKPKGGKKC